MSDDDKERMLKDGEMLFIHPEECIDCGACEPECPVEAIFPEEDVPEKWKEFTNKNYKRFEMSINE